MNPGIASSYIFSLKPGDKVTMSGPYGDFHPHFDSKREMIWVGGGAGMAPLRAQIMHMTKTLHTTISTTSWAWRRSTPTSTSIWPSTVQIPLPMQLA